MLCFNYKSFCFAQQFKPGILFLVQKYYQQKLKKSKLHVAVGQHWLHPWSPPWPCCHLYSSRGRVTPQGQLSRGRDQPRPPLLGQPGDRVASPNLTILPCRHRCFGRCDSQGVGWPVPPSPGGGNRPPGRNIFSEHNDIFQWVEVGDSTLGKLGLWWASKSIGLVRGWRCSYIFCRT